MTKYNHLNPQLLSSTTFWMGHIKLNLSEPAAVQEVISRYVQEHRVPVVGCFVQKTQTLTLLHWPDMRQGYKNSSIEDENRSLQELSILFGVNILREPLIHDNEIHTMMGRRIGGYDTRDIAPIEAVAGLTENLCVDEGYMVSARLNDDRLVEYGEPVAVLTGDSANEHEIHKIGEALQQHHYVIERAGVKTDFYQTHWATKEQL